MRKLTIGLLVACGALAAILKLSSKAVAPNTDANDIADNPAPYAELDAYVRRQMDRLRIPGVTIAIVEGDEIVHLRGFGVARPNGEAPTPRTPFQIGSLTKSFTALAVMQLVEAGKIDLGAPVQHYLPWFRVADADASAEITVRHLLHQTSGLSTASGWVPLADFDASPDATARQARALSTEKLMHRPGSTFTYSNSNYNLLGLIVEAASGESYADYIQDHIFTPLKMNQSYTSHDEAKENSLAAGHQYWFWQPVASPDLPMPRGSLPSGQLIASAEDMAHYMIALLNGGRDGDARILSETGVAELYRGGVEAIEMGTPIGEYGMGWYVGDIGQTKIAWHSGSTPDFGSYMALLPEQKKGVVLLVNTDHFLMVPALGEVGAGVAALLAGEEPARIRLGFVPWLMRGLLLIPILQIIGVVTTVGLLHRWRRYPSRRPHSARKWGLHVLLPLLFNLLVALTLIPMLGAMRGFWRLFAPDYMWIALICGGFAAVWAFVRTTLVIGILRKQVRIR